MKKNRKSLILILIIGLILFMNLHVISFGYEKEETTNYMWLKEEKRNVDTNKADEPKLNSRCAVVFDRNSKSIIFGKNENKRVPMASTTKIMTAIVLLESIEKSEELSLDTEIEVCKEAGAIRGSRLGLKKGDKISFNDLLYGLMLCSRK